MLSLARCFKRAGIKDCEKEVSIEKGLEAMNERPVADRKPLGLLFKMALRWMREVQRGCVFNLVHGGVWQVGLGGVHISRRNPVDCGE